LLFIVILLSKCATFPVESGAKVRSYMAQVSLLIEMVSVSILDNTFLKTECNPLHVVDTRMRLKVLVKKWTVGFQSAAAWDLMIAFGAGKTKWNNPRNMGNQNGSLR
jgi:hypothetical protein